MKTKSFALLFLLLAASAQAAYDIDRSGLHLNPPPKPGSAADQKDFAILFDYQNNRTDEQCRAAEAQSRYSLDNLFGPDTGVLSPAETARVEEFAAEVIDTVSKAVSPFKKRYHRARPYDENADLHPCIDLAGHDTSYPSGHAAIGYVLADVLAQVYPAKADALHKAGQQVGENRVLGGVHHPTDVIAGRKLGAEIEEALFQNDEFNKALEALK